MADYRAADIASHIINYAASLKKPVSNLQLQKMLFFCQCSHLQNLGRSLFSDDMVAWQYGPVVKTVYRTYSYRGASPITRAERYVENPILSRRDPILSLAGDSKQIVNNMVDAWIDKPAWDLVSMTHRPGGAWDRVYNADGVPASGYDNVIPIELMRAEPLT